MKKLIAMLAMTGLVILAPATGAAAGGPTCAGFGPGWQNHGEHVLTYVEGDGGAAGGKPAHHSADRSSAPAPGASFCLDQAQNPGLHRSDL